MLSITQQSVSVQHFKPTKQKKLSDQAIYALQLIECDLSVIPFHYRTKKPALNSWSEYKLRRADYVEIKTWFNDDPRNIAVVCGSVSQNLVVLDFDEAGTFEQFERAYPDVVNQTVVSKTARGYHVFLRLKSTYCPTGKAFFRDTRIGETRGNGGLAIVPHSMHSSGVKYEWVRSPLDCDILTIDSLSDIEIRGIDDTQKVKNHSSVKAVYDLESYAGQSLKNALVELSQAQVGERNNTLFNCAFKLSRFFESGSLNVKGVKEKLARIAVKKGLKMNEIERTIDSAFRYGSAAPLSFIPIARSDYRRKMNLSKLALVIYDYLKNYRINRKVGWVIDEQGNVGRVRVFCNLNEYYLDNLLACAITHQSLASEFNVNPSTITRKIDELKDNGFLREAGVEVETMDDGQKCRFIVYALGEIRETSNGHQYEHFFDELDS